MTAAGSSTDGAAGGAPYDRIALHGIRATGRHGVLQHERENGQEFILDVALELDTTLAASTDDLGDTVDYGALAADIAAIVSGDPVALIETLAERVSVRCLADSRVRATEVTVHKPHAPVTVPLDDVTVTIRRSRA